MRRAQLGQDGVIVERDTRIVTLVLTEQLRTSGIESREMEEAQRRTVHEIAAVLVGELARGKVPERHVPSRVTDRVLLEVHRSQVEPALVDEEAAVLRGHPVTS